MKNKINKETLFETKKTIKIKGITLTEEEAKEVYEGLKGIFEEKETVRYIPMPGNGRGNSDMPLLPRSPWENPITSKKFYMEVTPENTIHLAEYWLNG